MSKPAFIITIDTEGDNLWHNHHNILTENAKYLPRFQQLCEKYGFKPSWLTNYEMAVDPVYREFASDVIARNQGEVGMHLHAWNSPPLYELTGEDWRYKPYLIEYPEKIIKVKTEFITHLLEDTFQVKMRSHRAGRWAFNAHYARLLIDLGYQVDCSVTPLVNWQFTPGSPQGAGGTNYLNFLDDAYFIDEQDISRPGNSTLLEVPMTIHYKYPPMVNNLKRCYDQLRGKHKTPSVNWLRPKRNNLYNMLNIVKQSLKQGKGYIEFMLHSSELMPAGSPTFRDIHEIDKLYEDLEQLFDRLKSETVGMTLAEYYDNYVKIR